MKKTISYLIGVQSIVNSQKDGACLLGVCVLPERKVIVSEAGDTGGMA